MALQLRKMMSWFLLMVQLFSVLRIAAGFNFSKPNCVNHCGDVQIPYPFGIGANCYYNQSYEISCNMSSVSPKPFLQQFNLEVLYIQWPGRYSRRDPRWMVTEDVSRDGGRQVLTVALPRTNLCGGSSTKKIYSHDLKGSPYRFSLHHNSLTVDGCGTSAEIKQRNGEVLAVCGASVCGGYVSNTSEMSCNGVGCCQDLFEPNNYRKWESDVDFYEIDVNLGESSKNSMTCNASVAFIGNELGNNFEYPFNGSLSTLAIIPIALQWKATSFPPLLCHDGLTCVCPFPYEGNPYLPNGCQVVQGCQKCTTRCEVSYNINRSIDYYYCEKHLLFRRASFLDGGPFGNSVFSSEDNPPACFIEVQPFMATEYFTANVLV